MLQYANMLSAENFARSAEASAKVMSDWTIRMHDIAEKTEQDTVSMHVITIVTLIFLPGTFTAVSYNSQSSLFWRNFRLT